MSQVVGQPYPGPFTVDVTSLSGKLVDLPPGRAHLRAEKEGMTEVISELAASVPTAGTAAGVPKDVYGQFIACNGDLEQIRAHRALVDKLAEVLEESEAKLVHERENQVSIIVDAVRSMARRKNDPALVAPFEKTIKYNTQSAEKGAKTRRQNAEAKKQQQPKVGGEIA